MEFNTNCIVNMSEADEDFARVARLADEEKRVLIVKDDRPKYLLLEFEEYEKICREEELELARKAQEMLTENRNAYNRLVDL
ncbi:MAG: type II toxin-antitoxin system Phd/YefM family antitoxin [Syntrophomonadaceae bacterium]|nr:type II toxin-antitoxin system Phd/YefM family antitoxin [Syntrophomonadaceae bacterium]